MYKSCPTTDKYQSVELERPAEKFCNDSRNSISDSLNSTLLDPEVDSRLAHLAGRGFLHGKWVWLVHTVLLLLSFTMLVSAICTRTSTLKHVQTFSAYSPAAKAVEYQSIRFNTTMGLASPYVGKGPEIDKAWEHISVDVGDQMISEAELERIGMPKTSLKVKHPKTGVEGYRVGLEVFHQLHCIDLLRQVTYKEHYMQYTGDVGSTSREQLQMHTDHCLEILRLNVQCNADIGLFTLYLLPGDPLPWPELNTVHTCRNFDKVREWALENSVGSMERGNA